VKVGNRTGTSAASKYFMGRPLADLGGIAVLVALMGKNNLMPSACSGSFTNKAETPSSNLMQKTKDFDYKCKYQ